MSIFVMAAFTSDNIKIMYQTVMGNLHGQMVNFILEIGRKAKKMVKAFGKELMESNMKVNG